MNIKTTVVSLGIFGAGFGVGYIVCKKLLVEQYREDLEEVKQLYYNKIEELGVMDSDFEPDEDEDDEEPEYDEDDEDWAASQERDDREYFERVMKYSSGVRNDASSSKGKPIIKEKPPLEIEDWGDIEDEYDDEDELSDSELYELELEARAEEYAERQYRNKLNDLPYPIEFQEYEDGPDEYERRPLYYYLHDRTLCEEDDSIVEVDDIEELIGFDFEDILDMQTTCWIRNDNIQVMYEIYRIDDSYKTAVRGIVETPRERDFRIRGRRKQALDDRN